MEFQKHAKRQSQWIFKCFIVLYDLLLLPIDLRYYHLYSITQTYPQDTLPFIGHVLILNTSFKVCILDPCVILSVIFKTKVFRTLDFVCITIGLVVTV